MYHQVKLININILQTNKYYLSIKGSKLNDRQAKFTYSPLGKAFEKPKKTTGDKGRKQIDAIIHRRERKFRLTNNGGTFFLINI